MAAKKNSGWGNFFAAILIIAIAIFLISIALIIGGFIGAIIGSIIVFYPPFYYKLSEKLKIKWRPKPIIARLLGVSISAISVFLMLVGIGALTGLFGDDTSTATKPEQPAQTVEKEEIKKFKAEIVEVIDGDTFKAKIDGKTETVRMLLIDTPETVHPNKPEQPFGKEASEFTKKLLTAGKIVELELDKEKRDQYDRLLAYVYVDGKMVQEELLREGLARIVVYQPNEKYKDQFVPIEEEAKAKKIGIWSIENYVLEDGFNDEVKKEPKKVATDTSNNQSKESNGQNSASNTPVYSGRDMDCSDFSSQAEAQRYFESRGGSPTNNVDGLDRDHDGIACESLK